MLSRFVALSVSLIQKASPLQYTDWFTRAQPGGAAWPPLSRAPYPMFASSMLRTKAGVLVHAGQFPIVSLQVSWDDGFSWRFFDIDYNGATGGNGQIAEVAPNVLMYTYDGECTDGCPLFYLPVSFSEA